MFSVSSNHNRSFQSLFNTSSFFELFLSWPCSEITSLSLGILWCLLVNTSMTEADGGPQLSHEKNPGWLGFIGDYTIQLYGDYNKPL